MNIDEAVKQACEEPTLLDALSFIACWECGRTITQSQSNRDMSYTTCFKVSLKAVMDAYKGKQRNGEEPSR